MRKCLTSMALLLSYAITPSYAQLFTLETDTVCPKQAVNIISHAPNGASSYYWGFCSGYLKYTPVGSNMGTGFNFRIPGDIELAKYNNNYFGFLLDNASDSLYRLDFGARMNTTPARVNLGNLSSTIPAEALGTYLVLDSAANKYFLFAVAGNTTATSSITRIDFGSSLTNTPNVANMGNLFGGLDKPSSILVLKNNGNWYGFVTNTGTNDLVRLDFGINISTTPTLTNLGNVGGLDGATDMAAAMDDAGNWTLAIVNGNSSTLSLVAFGNDLSSLPIGVNVGNPDNKLFNPSAINYIKDCGGMYFFVTNALNGDVVRIEIDPATTAITAENILNPAGLNAPSCMSNILRDRDSLIAYVGNAGDGSLSQLKFDHCLNASIQSANTQNPPSFAYNTPGTYNIYLAVNEGQPNMQVYCEQITVIPYPGITISSDTTLCQHDTATISVNAGQGIDYTWYPDYHIDTLKAREVRVWPHYTTDYHAVITFDNGCVVDTAIKINVIKVNADAGEDRVISDGSTTLLGGPNTTVGGQYSYAWFPDDYLDKWNAPFVRSTPLHDFTYYLEVTTVQNGFTCKDIDTVVVTTVCDDLHLPNAFAPGSSESGTAKFGLLNKNILKLNYFRIFDRWGKKVFETTNPQEQWDGTYEGQPAALGVYVWTVDAFCIKGMRYEKSGNVTLIR